jgi:hypothetical protein
METGIAVQDSDFQVKVFTQRLDFYWQFISVYAIALFIYFFLKGMFFEATFIKVVRDPVVILLAVFIIGSAFALMYNAFRKRSIVVGKDYLIFKNRFSERKFQLTDIIAITVGREILPRSRGTRIIRIIRIKIKNRKRFVKIRTSSFWNSKELVNSLMSLKKAI